MPPKKTREQRTSYFRSLQRRSPAQHALLATRARGPVIQGLAPEVIAKKRKRHLEDLERSNYAENEEGNDRGKKNVRETISDKRTGPGKRKKSTRSIRDALVYRKNLATLIEESGIADLPQSQPTYLTALTPPSKAPPRLICSVCGYWGRYKCKRCAMPYCDHACEGTHEETRCERPLG